MSTAPHLTDANRRHSKKCSTSVRWSTLNFNTPTWYIRCHYQEHNEAPDDAYRPGTYRLRSTSVTTTSCQHKRLHWLLLESCIDFKIETLIFKVHLTNKLVYRTSYLFLSSRAITSFIGSQSLDSSTCQHCYWRQTCLCYFQILDFFRLYYLAWLLLRDTAFLVVSNQSSTKNKPFSRYHY